MNTPQHKEKNGYYYPYSEQASAVVIAMTEALKRLNVTVQCLISVLDIKKEHPLLNVL